VNNTITPPPKREEIQEIQEELLIGIYLSKEKNSIDYSYNDELLDLILYNKNIIAGLLENIKLDVLLGDKE